MARARPGEGRPYQRMSDGLWVVAVRDRDGRRKYLYASTSDAAIARRDEYVAGVVQGLDLASPKLTVGRQLDDWLADRRGKVRASTWVSYESHVRIHLDLVRRIPLVRLRQADVRGLIRERESAGCAPATINYSLTILRMAIGQALDDGIIPRNVASTVAGPHVEQADMRILTADEARHIVDSVELHPSGNLWALLVGTGLRLGEGLGLRRQDVDLLRRRVSVVKAVRPIEKPARRIGEARLQLGPVKTEASRRTIAIPGFAAQALAAESAIERPQHVERVIFTTDRGTLLDKRNALKSWVAFRDLAGLPPVRIHDLRHTAASLILANGGSLYDVMKHLGHSSISMTAETYGHLVEGRSRELADSMDRALGIGLDAAPDAAVGAVGGGFRA